MRRTTGRDDNCLGAENVKFTGTNVESNGSGDPVGLLLVHQQMGNHDAVVDFGGCLAGGLGDDRLVAFAVNHDLPFAFSLITTRLRIFHDWQAPLFEQVNRGIDMPGYVVAQILTHQTHEVVARVADMVLGLVLIPLHAHVAVNRIQALRNGATALDVRFFDNDDLFVASPIPGFVSGATTGHTAADDEDIRIYEYRFSSREQAHYTTPCLS